MPIMYSLNEAVLSARRTAQTYATSDGPVVSCRHSANHGTDLPAASGSEQESSHQRDRVNGMPIACH